MKTVMVVDDDPHCCALLAAFLGSCGYQAVPVPDSYAALDILDSDRTVDLAVIDIVMPPGHPHGYALAAMASLKRKNLPVVFVTGSAEFMRPDLAGDHPLLQKPVDLEALHEAVRARVGD
jgi:CheY-like chemotaxis protein